MEHYFDNIGRLVGVPAQGVHVLIRQSDGTPATLYSDNGVTQKSNPLTTDVNGAFDFYAANGTYTWTVPAIGGTMVQAGATLFDVNDATTGYVLASNLSASSGSSLVGTPDGGTVQVSLISKINRVIDSIAALKSLNKAQYTRAFVTGYYAAGDGGGGPYWYDSSDTTSADNGGTIIVAADGGRWKLQYGNSVSVKQFGVIADAGTTDNSTTLANCAAWIKANATRNKLTFPSGIYGYSVSPNWAADNVVIEADGEVRLRYSGTGNAVILDAGASSTTIYNMRMGRFFVEAPATALDGVFVRSIHHSKFGFNVRGCGNNSAAIHVQFSVCTEFDRPTVSVNENGGWYLNAKPKYGLMLGVRAAGEKVQACTFFVPVIEGVSGDGIYVDGAALNTFIGGTSEANTGYGLTLTSNSSYNTFKGTDLEANTGGGLQDSGTGNIFDDVLNVNVTTINVSAKASTHRGGLRDAIVDNGLGTVLDGVAYSQSGGTITGSGLRGTRGVLNQVTGKFDPDQPVGSLIATVSTASGVATTALTLPSTGTSIFNVTAYLPGAGDAVNYGAYAVVFQDGATARIVSQTNAPKLTIALSGMNVQVTQTSGVTINVYAAAKPI